MISQKPATVTVHDQAIAYNRFAPDFTPETTGQWVLIAGLKPFGFFETAEEAEQAADDKGFDMYNRYIRRVGSPPPFVVFMS